MKAVRLSADAEEDLDGIWLYVAERGDDSAANRLLDEITSCFAMFARHPEIGGPRDELKRGVRSHAVGNYVIFYRIRESAVVILRVLHGARDVGAQVQ